MSREDTVCWETDRLINKLNTRWWHGSIAHVLPKSKFKSVATHPMNYMILDLWTAHKEYDSSWEAATKMKIWPEAVRRFKIMYPAISEEEKRHIPDVFRAHVENILKK